MLNPYKMQIEKSNQTALALPRRKNVFTYVLNFFRRLRRKFICRGTSWKKRWMRCKFCRGLLEKYEYEDDNRRKLQRHESECFRNPKNAINGSSGSRVYNW